MKTTIKVSAWNPCSRADALQWFYEDTEEGKKKAHDKYVDLLVTMPSSMKISIDYGNV